MADHTDQHRCTSSALKHKQHHRLIPFPSAADQDEDLSVENLHVCAKQLWSDTHSSQQLPLSPSLPSCWQLGVEAPLQLLVHVNTGAHQ